MSDVDNKVVSQNLSRLAADKALALGSGAINAFTDVAKYSGLATNWGLNKTGLRSDAVAERTSRDLYDLFDNIGTKKFAASRNRLREEHPYTHFAGEIGLGAALLAGKVGKTAFSTKSAVNARAARDAKAVANSAGQETGETAADIVFKPTIAP